MLVVPTGHRPELRMAFVWYTLQPHGGPMSRLLFLGLFTVAACSSKLPDANDTGAGAAGSGSGADGGNGEGGEDGPGVEDLPDPRADVAFDADCTDVDGYPVPGATSFFYGGFGATADSDVWEGEEQWILVANDAWREAGEDDCAITWNVVAERSDEAGACGDCAYGLTVAASIDLARSSCPEGLYEGSENFSVVYGVRVSDGAAEYVYAQNGNPLGTGHANENASNYLSAAACVWF